jgi:tetratricopeptide (TPR) repeat protein
MKATWKSTILPGALLVLMIFVLYWPAMRGGFLFDDCALVSQNQLIHADNGLYRIWFTSDAVDYWPITYSAWWFEWRLWGGKAGGFHAVNVGLHGIDTVLVWLVLRRLRLPGAWVAAALFAVHPVNVATVAWISETKNTLSMLFYLASILAYLEFSEKGFRKWYLVSLIAFALALLSKTSVVMGPVVLLGLAWWKHGRVSGKDVRRAAPFFALSLLGAWVTIMHQHSRLLYESPDQTTGFAGRVAVAGWALWFYLYKILVPVNLMLIYPNWKVDEGWWISYAPTAGLVGAMGILWWKRKTWGRPALFGLGYFAVMLFPVLGFFHQFWQIYSRVSDQWQYCAMIGVLAVLAAGATKVWGRINVTGRSVGAIVGVAVFVFLGMATWKRSALFADEESLWRDNIARNPQAWVAYNNLAGLLGEQDKIDEAIQVFNEAIRVKPDYVEAYNNRGNALVVAGRVDDAMADYRHALSIYPACADSMMHIGEVYWRQGDARDAIGNWKEALFYEPESIDVLNNLAWALATADASDGGDPVQAVVLARNACELTDYREATYLDTLGVAYAAEGDFGEAVETAQKAIDLARAHGDEQLASRIQGRLDLYRAGKAYRAK